MQQQDMSGSRLETFYRNIRLFAPGGPIVEGYPDEISALGGIMSDPITHIKTMPDRTRSTAGLPKPRSM
jgi:hypothetical protein